LSRGPPRGRSTITIVSSPRVTGSSGSGPGSARTIAGVAAMASRPRPAIEEKRRNGYPT
jgi:hypothetical protein